VLEYDLFNKVRVSEKGVSVDIKEKTRDFDKEETILSP